MACLSPCPVEPLYAPPVWLSTYIKCSRVARVKVASRSRASRSFHLSFDSLYFFFSRVCVLYVLYFGLSLCSEMADGRKTLLTTYHPTKCSVTSLLCNGPSGHYPPLNPALTFLSRQSTKPAP